MDSSRTLLWQIALILQDANLLPAATERLIERAYADLQQAIWGEVTSTIFIILQTFLPEKCLEFDTELDSCADAVEVLQIYDRATAGELALEHSRDGDILERDHETWQTLDFTCRGTGLPLEFSPYE